MVGNSGASLASTHQRGGEPPQSFTTKSISGLCEMPSGGEITVCSRASEEVPFFCLFIYQLSHLASLNRCLVCELETVVFIGGLQRWVGSVYEVSAGFLLAAGSPARCFCPGSSGWGGPRESWQVLLCFILGARVKGPESWGSRPQGKLEAGCGRQKSGQFLRDLMFD